MGDRRTEPAQPADTGQNEVEVEDLELTGEAAEAVAGGEGPQVSEIVVTKSTDMPSR